MSRMIVTITIFMLLLAACQNNEKEQPPVNREATPTFGGLSSLPTLPGFEQTKPTLPVDESVFPIEPGPAGQTLYEINCSECHGFNGEGQYPDDPYGTNEEGLLGAPPHDNNGHTWHHPDPVLFEIIY